MKIINPLTNKSILVGGPKFKQLLKQGYIFKDNKLILQLSLIESILYEAIPNDLLSLYLVDQDIKKILDSKFLQLLNAKYNIKSTNFINFFKTYNINYLTSHHLLYLYNLENTLYRPPIKTLNRYECVDYLFKKRKELKLSPYIFGLAVTLMDTYQIYTFDVAMVSLYIATYTLEEYVTFDVTIKNFNKIHIDIIKQLNGQIIRPSTIFFTKHHKEAMQSYFNNHLLKYKPSLIAETINYMVSGDYKIYIIAEMPCHLLNIKSKYNCQQSQYIKQLINKPKIWHLTDFQKIESIGQGVGGKVYKIKKNKKYYVLKTIKDNIESSILEIMALQNLKNPNIVQLYGFKVMIKKTELYLTLGQYNLIEMKNININDAIHQLLKGLDYCHYNNIIHRDIKPENIIYDGFYKLIDFGLTVPYSNLKTYLDPDVCGTINYRAPEALLGSTKYDMKVDIWALCLVFYYIINKKQFTLKTKINDVLLDIYKQFGSPNNKTWPGVIKLPNYKKTNYKGKKLNFGKYQYLKKGLILNPKKRATTSSLLIK